MDLRHVFTQLKRWNVYKVAVASAVIAGSALPCPLDASAAPRPRSDGTIAAITAIAEAEMKEQQIPGLALVVMKRDEVMLARGFGREDLARDDPVTEQTVFGLGSIAKQFVAALVLQLAEEGRLSVDDSVAQHLPEFTQVPPELKIRHLLSHTSGMREEFVQDDLRELFDKPGTTFAEYVAAASDAPCDWPPGSRWSYGNINYLMLTVIVERVLRQPLEEALDLRVFAPLDLRSMRLCSDQPGDAQGQARGYVLHDRTLLPHPRENVALFRGSGGFCGSAVDL
ncbi:MAG TPA: serine hydrolase domain-containing protein, partial [Chthoniobacterales bacterium]|nr:serine hydrolase domain-containing protein [Chthoniobacterales bacterium]